MARRSPLAVAAGCVVMLTLPTRSTRVPDRATKHLDRAIELLLAPAPTTQDTSDGFLSLLDALISTVPDSPPARACSAKLTEARQLASQTSILDGRLVALLRECYRDTHGGVSYRTPDSIRSLADAVDYCRAQLESSRGLLEKGRRDEAFGRMIDAAVFIVTPMERHASGSEVWIRQLGRWWTAVRLAFLERFAWLSTVRSSSSG